VFRAPRFEGKRKVANARFVKVVLNGAVVQENVEVTGPTRAAPFQDEQPTGPLMIQGDHGPVALRNIEYKSYTGAATLSDLRFRAFTGDQMDPAWIDTHTPVRQGAAVGSRRSRRRRRTSSPWRSTARSPCRPPAAIASS
jgi:hypothetical protein